MPSATSTADAGAEDELAVVAGAPVSMRSWPIARILFPGCLLCLALLNLSSPRSFDEQQVTTSDGGMLVPLLAKGFFVLLIGIYVASAYPRSAPVIRLRSYARLWLLTGFSVWGLGTALSLALGTAHDITPQWFLVMALTLLLVWRLHPEDGLIEGVRDAVAIFAALGLLLLPVVPRLVAQLNYPGPLPLRLAGLANHPNSLAPLMLLGLIALTLRPYARLSLSLTVGWVLVIALLLAQSKTTLVIGVAISVAGVAQYLHGRWRALGLPAGVMLAVAGGLTLSLLTVGIALALANGAWTEVVLPYDSLVGDFTGRQFIWDFTLSIWHRNEWFGYGYGSLWNDSMRQEFFRLCAWRPGYSHSLYYQTLGESGIIGMVGMSWLLLSLLVTAAQCRARYVMITLVAGLIAIRGITEVTWGTVPYSENATLMFFLVALLVGDQRARVTT